ncbi:MAG: HEAT repeat domain-containing protein [Phycisphaerae bacterium]
MSVGAQDREILDMLLEVDKQASRENSRWAEKRMHVRKTARIPCEVRFIGPDGESVLYTLGRTREVAAGGLSFLSRQHFARRCGILVTLSLSGGKIRSLSARVVYSRWLREGWYLTGVRFGAAEDPRLDPRNYSQVVAQEARFGNEEDPVEEDDKVPSRQRVLQFLAMASAAHRRTKTMVAKVVMASMSSDHVVRRASIPVLQRIAGREGLTCLVSMLRDSNPEIQGEAAEALGMMGFTEALEPLQQLCIIRMT